MTKKEFVNGPGLLMEKEVVSLGFARPTIEKFVELGVLKKVKPVGCSQARYQKRQLALLLEWTDVAAGVEQAFAAEPQMMGRKEVLQWTGMSKETLDKMAEKGGLRAVRLPGCNQGKYRKADIAAMLGLERWV
jgi:hypothetical protein